MIYASASARGAPTAVEERRAAHAVGSLNVCLLAWQQGRPEFPALLQRANADHEELRHMGLPVATFVAAAEGRDDEARHVLNGRERETWRSAFAALRHMGAGWSGWPVAAFGDSDQIVALYDELVDHSGTWVANFANTYRGAADHHLGMLARALGRTDEAEERLRAALASYDAAPERLFRAARSSNWPNWQRNESTSNVAATYSARPNPRLARWASSRSSSGAPASRADLGPISNHQTSPGR